MMVGDRQILILSLLSSLNLCDISNFYCSLGFKKTTHVFLHMLFFSFLSSGVFSWSADHMVV